jgi:hypothetical protein
MLKWKNVIGLSEGDEAVAGKVEGFIDLTITTQSQADQNRRSFAVPRAELVTAAGVDVLTIKVKGHVMGKYVKDGWVLAENQHAFIFTAPLPKRGGGRPKGSKNTPATPPVVATTVQPVTAPESAPAQTPAEPATV